MDTKKRVLTGTNATFTVILIVVGAILLNVVVSRFPETIDLTDNQIYTLSEASVDAVSGLEEPIEVKVFISPDMPPPFHTLSQQVGDLLADYAANSGGKLSYQIISPSADDTEAEEAAAGFGIEKVALGQRTEDEVSLRAVYKGVAFVQGEKTEVIRDLQATGNPELDNFEYQFTKALLNLRSTEPRTVAFLSGFGGPAMSPQFVQSVQPTFESLYGSLIEVTTVDLSAEDATIPEEVDAIVVLNIDQIVSDKAKFQLDQFVQKGGSLGWYQSAAVTDVQLQRQLMQQMGNQRQIPDIRKQAETGLIELFSTYGIEYRHDVVLDRENALALGLVMTPRGLAQVSHPASFLMQDIDRTAPFMQMIPALAIPAPASVVVRPELNESEDIKAYELVKTAASAVRRPTPPNSMNYQEFMEPMEGEQPGPFTVAAALEGDVPSLFADKPLPEGVSEDQVVTESNPSRILVVGSGEFFSARPNLGFNQQLAGMGGQFLLNSIEWLVQDNALTQIRGKNMPTLIGEVPRETQRSIQFINIAMVPALFAALGYFVLVMRRRRRSRFSL